MRVAAGFAPWRVVCAAMVMAMASSFAWPQAVVAEIPDEVFPESDLLSGKRTSRSECEATRHAVWVVHKEGEACIRYFPSSNVDGAKTAAFFFHGDVLEGRFVIKGAYRNNKASVLLKTSEDLARVNAMPYILVARPGVFGSSGSHLERRRLEEYLALNAAVDAIKAKHGIKQVHLGGQSGGATSVGALLTLGRSDVVCAAASSGGFNALGRAQDMARQRSLNWNGCDAHGVCGPYNVTDHVAGILASPTRRIFLVGDPQDSNTAFRYQQEFADKIAAANHKVAMLTADARGPQHHSLAHMANRVLGWCNAGYDTDRIAALARSNALALRAPPPKPKSSASSAQPPTDETP